jgi:hypothetical protein
MYCLTVLCVQLSVLDEYTGYHGRSRQARVQYENIPHTPRESLQDHLTLRGVLDRPRDTHVCRCLATQ